MLPMAHPRSMHARRKPHAARMVHMHLTHSHPILWNAAQPPPAIASAPNHVRLACQQAQIVSWSGLRMQVMSCETKTRTQSDNSCHVPARCEWSIGDVGRKAGRRDVWLDELVGRADAPAKRYWSRFEGWSRTDLLRISQRVLPRLE
jgi:hypothetical protein